MKDNNKKTWRDVWSRLATVETQLNMIISNTQEIPKMIQQIEELQQDCNDNKEEHKTFWKTFVSSKAFFAWLSALAIAIGIITTILFMR